MDENDVITTISATVMGKTKDTLEAMMKGTQLTMGEVIDRLALQMSPTDGDTASVIASEQVKGSKKLLKNTVKIGDETRIILSGIAKYYTPEEMVGKKVVVVANLVPRKMMGEVSHGMILCAADAEGHLSLMTDDKQFPSGCEVR